MRIAFVSSYLSPHQLPFCLAMSAYEAVEFTFIATIPVSEERLKLGYQNLDRIYPFVICAYDGDWQSKLAEDIIEKADIVIAGKAPWQLFVKRIKQKKIVIRYSERQLKKGLEPIKYMARYIRWKKTAPPNSPCYLLCASAYAAYDYSLFGLYKNKAFKWGYFPEKKEYDSIESVIQNKKKTILWAGRLLDWKRPDFVIELAKRLKNKGKNIEINIIGTGPLENALRSAIDKYDLMKMVHLLGAMEPDEVRQHMEKSSVFVFTSNRQEGWGAVLNEAMNSGCAVVASDVIGSAPFLIDDNVNGMLFKHNDLDDFIGKVETVLADEDLCFDLGKRAYETIINHWNAQNAADRLIELCSALLAHQDPNVLFKEGICSPAEIIKDNWKN